MAEFQQTGKQLGVPLVQVVAEATYIYADEMLEARKERHEKRNQINTPEMP